jgi:hypothetical protein
MKPRRRWMGAARVAMATAVLGAAAEAVLAAAGADVYPSYVIPNLAACVMCLTVVLIACKRFRAS